VKVAYLDAVGGLAGDMLLAALLDAGAPRAALDDVVRALRLDVEIAERRAQRHGIEAMLLDVAARPRASARPARELLDLVAATALPDRVRERSLEALRRLATVEAVVHGAQPEAVVLHELGGDDTLVDICGVFALLEALEVRRVVGAPLPYSRGLIGGPHGTLPSPAPATLALLEGAPLRGVGVDGELVTPTGAAIAAVAVDAWGELPAMTLGAVGYGAGTRDVSELPNVLRVVLGIADAERPGAGEVVLLEANLDDLVPELVPDAIERCVAAGALDVWVVPVQMKKGRPGVVVSAIARPQAEHAVAVALLEHTSTLGVRVSTLRRHELDRRVEEVEVDGRPIRVKVGLLDGRVVNVAPEHDDCAAVAAGTGRPVKQVWAEALVAATALVTSGPGA
jgi:pyridinium-3,5-bisthiocarboxylic acid mononucleotide nickel chelatase